MELLFELIHLSLIEHCRQVEKKNDLIDHLEMDYKSSRER